VHARQVEYGYGIRLNLILLGKAHLGLGHDADAFECFREAGQQRGSAANSIDWILQMQLCHGLSDYWLAREEFSRAAREGERLCALAAQPGERTYVALGRRILSEVALAGHHPDQAQAELDAALAMLETGEAPLAAWRVYATAARVHERRGRRVEAEHYRRRAAMTLQRLATSLGDAAELRRSLLAHPPVRTILHGARAGARRGSPGRGSR